MERETKRYAINERNVITHLNTLNKRMKEYRDQNDFSNALKVQAQLGEAIDFAGFLVGINFYFDKELNEFVLS